MSRVRIGSWGAACAVLCVLGAVSSAVRADDVRSAISHAVITKPAIQTSADQGASVQLVRHYHGGGWHGGYGHGGYGGYGGYYGGWGGGYRGGWGGYYRPS